MRGPVQEPLHGLRQEAGDHYVVQGLLLPSGIEGDIGAHRLLGVCRKELNVPPNFFPTNLSRELFIG